MSGAKGAGVFDDLARGGTSVTVTVARMVVLIIPSFLSVGVTRYSVADGRTSR